MLKKVLKKDISAQKSTQKSNFTQKSTQKSELLKKVIGNEKEKNIGFHTLTWRQKTKLMNDGRKHWQQLKKTRNAEWSKDKLSLFIRMWRLDFENSLFQNFSFLWIVSDSVSKKLVIKKVSDSVSKKFGIRKSFGFSFVQIWVILGKVSVLKLLGFETFPFFIGFGFSIKKFSFEKKVSDSV